MDPTMKKTKLTKETKAVNAAFLAVSRELKRFRVVCARNGSPLRYITYRVFDDGNTRLHVAYRRK